MNRQQILNQARSALANGQITSAIRVCEKLVRADPRDVEARHLIGRGQAALGHWSLATSEFRRVLSQQPSFFPALFDLGISHIVGGEFREAKLLLEQARALDATPSELHFGLGVCYMELGDLSSAKNAYEESLSGNPQFPDACNNLGVINDRLGNLTQAVECFRKAIAIQPDFAAAHRNLGDALLRGEQPLAAASAFEQAARLCPAEPLIHADLGAARLSGHDYSGAIVALERALALNANLTATAANLSRAYASQGVLLHRQHRLPEAIASYQQALMIDSNRSEILLNMGLALEAQGSMPAAIDTLNRALQSVPENPEALAALTSCASRICDWSTMAKSLSQLEKISDGIDFLHPFLMLALDLDPNVQAQSLNRRSQISTDTLDSMPKRPHAKRRPLRVAYLSPDFREHPVAFALAGVIDHHNRRHITPIGVSLATPDVSPISRRLQSSFESFIDATSLSDLDLVKHLRDQNIDVAVDLAGHTVGARSEIFAHRIAPIQMSYLGFPGSTGFAAMDYLVADDTVLPHEDEGFYSERVLRGLDCYLPFDDSRPAPDTSFTREDAGLPAEGFIFCAFNNGYKITRAVFEVWMRLLHVIPGSVLWLRNMDVTTIANLRAAADTLQVSPERLIVAPFVKDIAEHVSRLRLANLFLDTLPYNAHTTAAEALWAGVPVITCRGRSFAARVGASLLASVGLSELICPDLITYERRAVEIASSPTQRLKLTQHLDERRNERTLFNTQRYTIAFDKILLEIAGNSA